MILREESEGKLKYLPENSDVVIQTSSGTELLRLPAKEFEHQAMSLLYSLQSIDDKDSGRKGAFSISYTGEAIDLLDTLSL